MHYSYGHDQVWVNIHTYIHTYVHVYVHKVVYTYMKISHGHVFVHERLGSRVRVGEYTYTYMHTYIHTYIHT